MEYNDKELKPEEIFSEGGAAKIIAIAEKEAAEFVGDVTTVKGRAAIKSKAYAIGSTMKAKFDNMGKEYGEELKKKAKIIDAERSKIRVRLEELGEQIRKPVNEFEAREEARINLIKEHIAALEAYGVLTDDDTSDSVQSKINAINGFNFTDWQEFDAQAKDIKTSILDALEKRLISVEKAEAERKELERLRAEAAERERKEAEAEAERVKKEHDERVAAEAEAKAKKEAEDKAASEAQAAAEKAASEKAAIEAAAAKAKADAEASEARAKAAEAARVAAEEKAKADAIAAANAAEAAKQKAIEDERQRVAAAEKAAAEAEAKRKADTAHRAEINNGAVSALVEAGLSVDDAKKAVIAIAKGNVPNVTIRY